MSQEHPNARRLQGSEYVDDTGAADAALTAALRQYDGSPAGYPFVLAALADARLLVPVVALLGEVEVGDDGLARDKSSDMAAVMLTGADGRMALLAFTSTETLQQWDPEARPVPVAARLAAATAVQEDAAALLVDVAGPTSYVLEGEDLHRIASGWRPVQLPDGRWGWLAAQEDGPEDSAAGEQSR